MEYPSLPNKKYEIVYLDPPWDYKGQTTFLQDNITHSVNNHYPTITLDELKELNVPSILDDNALVFMWSSNPHLDQAMKLGIEFWGLAWATVGFVWHKDRQMPGYYTMSSCELCLIFKKGKIPKPRGRRNIEQFFSQKTKIHSRKPLEIQRRIELMFPTQRKLEMFARAETPGWDVWGNETEKFNPDDDLLIF